MFFGGTDDAGVQRIGHVDSADGVNWLLDTVSIDLAPMPNSWEGQSVGTPRVLDVGGELLMYYAGGGGPGIGSNACGIGLAFINEAGPEPVPGPVPEPITLASGAIGLAWVGAYLRRRMR